MVALFFSKAVPFAQDGSSQHCHQIHLRVETLELGRVAC